MTQDLEDEFQLEAHVASSAIRVAGVQETTSQ
jgi:hypothetical protein